MGNGQNRNRRGGARTRHGPHRGGGANSDRRGVTQLIPPVRVASADATADTNSELDDISTLDTEGDSALVHADEPAEASTEAFTEAFTESASQAPQIVAEEPAPSAESTDSTEHVHATRSAEQPEQVEVTEEPERRAPRGRFERFYAPGLGPRAEPHTTANGASNGATNGAAHGATNGAAHLAAPHATVPQATPPLGSGHAVGHAAGRHPVREPLSTQAPQAEDDDEVAPFSGPREDVRGAVGELIDALHELFTQDRAVASQGGSARCGICYFHYRLSELIYREAEGFYVCQGCERALGVARISMVRRQQRQ